MSSETVSSPPVDDPLVTVLARWRSTVENELKGVPFEKKLVTRLPEGIALQPLYSALDTRGLADAKALPGQAPFTRGKSADGYRSARWECAQEIAAATPKEFNEALSAELMCGQDSVVLPTHGFGGAEASLAAALEGVDLRAVTLHYDVGARPRANGEALLACSRHGGTPTARLRGSITGDPLAVWVKNGSLPESYEKMLDELAAWRGYLSLASPAMRSIGVSTLPWANAGASANQELAFALEAGTEYIRALVARGANVADVARAMRFSFAAGNQFFVEVAKFRAFRPLWSRVLAAFGEKAVEELMPVVQARTSDWTKTVHDAHVNMLRVTTEALSAVLGGVESLHIAPYDEVSGATNGFSRRIARNLHTLLSEEFSFTDAADPAGGSWYIEKLTDELARRAWILFQEIEAAGGYVAALRAGVPQAMVEKTAAAKADAIDRRRQGIIGTNLFPNLNETALAAPAPLTKAAQGAEPIKPATARRAAEKYEALRAAAKAYAISHGGKAPQVFLAKIGPVVQHKARADFTTGFFAAGGFKPMGKDSFPGAAEAAKAAIESGAPVAVLCSTDDTYPELVPAFAGAVKAVKPEVVVIVAGLPADEALAKAWKAAGVDEFIHLRANNRVMLESFLKKIGALS